MASLASKVLRLKSSSAAGRVCVDASSRQEEGEGEEEGQEEWQEEVREEEGREELT
jgi:hypothetical protein